MIDHPRFGKLRLAQFLPRAEIVKLDNWEFMDSLWVGEAIGFSEWLRLKSEPDTLRSLAVDFAQIPYEAAQSILRKLELPVSAGMSVADVRKVLGDPVEELRFVPDRVTYEFVFAGPDQYNVSCTVLNDGGLLYLTVMRLDFRSPT